MGTELKEDKVRRRQSEPKGNNLYLVIGLYFHPLLALGS